MIEGVIVIVLEICSKVEFVHVKVGIFPVPLAINPIDVLELAHENCKPVGVVGAEGVPVNTNWGTVEPSQ